MVMEGGGGGAMCVDVVIWVGVGVATSSLRSRTNRPPTILPATFMFFGMAALSDDIAATVWRWESCRRRSMSSSLEVSVEWVCVGACCICDPKGENEEEVAGG